MDKSKNLAMSYVAYEERLIQNILGYLIKQPYNEVSGYVQALHSNGIEYIKSDNEQVKSGD